KKKQNFLIIFSRSKNFIKISIIFISHFLIFAYFASFTYHSLLFWLCLANKKKLIFLSFIFYRMLLEIFFRSLFYVKKLRIYGKLMTPRLPHH
ncbi:hypothetical protein GLOIN_2v1589974, partial [Rhizophagus irregularis DAOM 181602=DAOM 197198]